jgi:hypothetical protein
MKDYVKTFTGYSITTEQWREHLFHYFGSLKHGSEYIRKLGKIDWDEVRKWCHSKEETEELIFPVAAWFRLGSPCGHSIRRLAV